MMNYMHSTLIILLIHQSVNSSISTKQTGINGIFPDTIEYFEIELKYCGCKRRIKKLPAHHNSAHNILFNHTTCSMDAYNRGMGQKIVGFSLYGDYTSDRL